MVADDAENSHVETSRPTLKSVLFGFSSRDFRKFRIFGFGSIYGRIIVMNVLALVVLLSGILYLDQTKEGLIDAKLESLITQSVVIAGALSASASEDDFGDFDLNIDEFLDDNADINITQDDVFSTISVPIDPEAAAQIL
ncbi:MAG: sensor N-terminal transmembrane domain-containing protein, partial [OCS116 cluster bacterium]|nr:sensor N-terminal transmembrane domain-containing protein [OCS116 cluster bacterium]